MNRRHIIPGILAAILVILAGAAIGTAVGKIGGGTSTVTVLATGSIITTTDHGKKVVVHVPGQTVTRDGALVTLPPSTQTVARSVVVPGKPVTVTRTIRLPASTITRTTTKPVTVTVPVTITGPTQTVTSTETATVTETVTTTPGNGSGPPPSSGP
jgi:hypothetical protein